MSTKIYDAYRLKADGPQWDTLWGIQDQARKNVEKKAQDYYKAQVLDLHYDDPEYTGDPSDWWKRLMYVYEKTKAGVLENAGSMSRSEFDVDCYVAVMPFEGRFYLRAFCDSLSSLVGGCLDFLNDHPDLEDYHYQNSTDKPKGVSRKDWDERKQTWDKIFSGPAYTARNVRLDICNPTDFWLRCRWEAVSRDFHESPPEIPTIEEVALQRLQKGGGYFDSAIKASTPEPGVILANDFVIRKTGDEWEVDIRGKKHSHKWLHEIVSRVKIACLPEERRKAFESMLER